MHSNKVQPISSIRGITEFSILRRCGSTSLPAYQALISTTSDFKTIEHTSFFSVTFVNSIHNRTIECTGTGTGLGTVELGRNQI